MTSVQSILRETFGFPAFRGVQQQVVDRVMAGRHALAVMPTGAGKSLCYQVPALARPGTGRGRGWVVRVKAGASAPSMSRRAAAW